MGRPFEHIDSQGGQADGSISDARTVLSVTERCLHRLARPGSVAYDHAYTAALLAALAAWRAWDGRGSREAFTGHRAWLAASDALRTLRGRITPRLAPVPLAEIETEPVAAGSADARAEARQAMRLLRPAERRIAAGLARGETQAEIGRRMGITQGRVSHLYKRYHERMKAA